MVAEVVEAVVRGQEAHLRLAQDLELVEQVEAQQVAAAELVLLRLAEFEET